MEHGARQSFYGGHDHHQTHLGGGARRQGVVGTQALKQGGRKEGERGVVEVVEVAARPAIVRGIVCEVSCARPRLGRLPLQAALSSVSSAAARVGSES
jgi:hypothetical protein